MEAPTPSIRRVLVVSTDATDRQVIEDATRAWMFETLVCSSLSEAKERLAEGEFTLVFCEERFEGGGYPELLSVVRGSYKIPVVVMISGEEPDRVFREAMKLGAFGVIPRPCSAKDVQWMVIRATQQGANSKSGSSSRNASPPASDSLPRRA